MGNKDWPRSNRWIRWSLTILAVVAFVGLIVRIGNIQSEAATSDRLVLLAVLVVFHLPTLLESATLFFSLRRRSAETVRYRRPLLWHICYRLLMQMPLAYVLAISFGRLWTWESVGFSSHMSWTWNMTAGIGWAIVFLFARRYVDRFMHRTKNIPDAFDASLVRLNLPRGNTAQRLQAFEMVLFSPIFEELVCRGFFVYFVGMHFGSAAVGIVLGFVFCVWLHLYLGPSKLLSVVSFYAATIVLLYSPFGLLSVMTFHMMCNARYIWQLRSYAEFYVEHVRDQRLTMDRESR